MENNYDENSIAVLEGLEPVKLRPSMYIGNVDVEGLHHLVYEVVDNSVDEAMAGYCDLIKVTIHVDNSISVEDNGRGIPVGVHKTEKVPAVEVVLTKLHAGGKFDNNSYKVSGGLHGVGVSVVNALSKLLEVEIYYDGEIYYQTYEKGIKTSELKVIGKTKKEGTKIHFIPDLDIFNTDNFSYDILSRRLRELSFLNKGLKIRIEDERTDNKNEFFYKGGIVSFVEYLNKRHSVIHKPIFIEGVKDDAVIEVAIQYIDTFKEKIFSYANNINTTEGGFHLIGFKTALTRTLNQYAINGNLPKNLQAKLSGEDIREGLTAIISVRIEIKGLVESLVNEKLSFFLEENLAVAKKIVAKAVDALRARDAAKRARDLARKQGSLMDSSLPGKLAECQNVIPSERELFVVEGDSAGGSAKQGRDRKFQAILPLKGKIINIEKARLDKVLSNEEIKNIITVLGTGVGQEEYNINNIKYHKVIIMTDADVDGSHIRTLLLTFFYRQMKEIIEKGYLYIAQPPLFSVGKGKNKEYLKDETELNDYILKRVCNNKSIKFGKDEKTVAEHKLYLLTADLSEYFVNMLILEKRGINSHLVEILIKEGVENKNFLQDRQKMLSLKEVLQKEGYDVGEILWKNERNFYEMSVSLSENNTEKSINIGINFVYSTVFQKSSILAKKILWFDQPPFFIYNQGKESEPIIIEDKRRLLSYIMEEGKKGIAIQRYKGLGEMNPEQLWQTTMDPEKRSLLQVKVDDIAETDEIFTILMGEEVEPRREFIQNNALEVSTLDI